MKQKEFKNLEIIYIYTHIERERETKRLPYIFLTYTSIRKWLYDMYKATQIYVLFYKSHKNKLLSYMKWIASPGSMHDTGCLGLVHWDDPEGWYREGGESGGSGSGTRVHLWQIHVDAWQNQYNIVK